MFLQLHGNMKAEDGCTTECVPGGGNRAGKRREYWREVSKCMLSKQRLRVRVQMAAVNSAHTHR